MRAPTISKMIGYLDYISQWLTDNGLSQDDFIVYDFDQMWASTALGFPGVGGSAMTWGRTYVLVSRDPANKVAHVFFNGMFAYSCTICENLWEDIKNQNIAHVIDSGRYK